MEHQGSIRRKSILCMVPGDKREHLGLDSNLVKKKRGMKRRRRRREARRKTRKGMRNLDKNTVYKPLTSESTATRG